eukprot:XP_025001160.1 olfactory receptor 14J1-like [Gallus gallus]
MGYWRAVPLKGTVGPGQQQIGRTLDKVSALLPADQVYRSHLSVENIFHMLFLIRKPGMDTPLHYGTLLDSRACATMAAAAWGTGVLNALLHTASTFSLPLCQGNAVDQFFCEIPHILKLSCSQSYLREVGLIVFSVLVLFGCFAFILFSYVQIFRAVLRMPSEQGRHKAFSTCLPHLAVVSLFLSTGFFANLRPPSLSSPSLDLMMAFLYSVVPPTLNPLIYSMRNQELRHAVRKMVPWSHFSRDKLLVCLYK